MGCNICIICRLRLTELHQFRTHCQRVQDALQCMIRPPARGVAMRKAVPEAEVQYVSQQQLNKPLEDYNGKELDGKEVTEVDQSMVRQDRLMEVKIEAKDEEIDQKYGTHMDAVEQMPRQDITFETVKLESDPVESTHNIVETDNHAELQDKTVRDENLIGIDDMMVLEEVKIESEDLTSDMEDQASSIHVMTEDVNLDYSTPASVTDDSVQPEEATSSSKQLQCNICAKVLPNKKALNNHNRIHRKDIACPLCKKRFYDRTRMQNHMRTHLSTKERLEKRPFQCDICRKPFGLQKYLTAHYKQQHGPKPYECSVCGLRYSMRYLLETHMASHRNNGESKEDFPSIQPKNPDDSDSEQNSKEPQTSLTDEYSVECGDCHKLFRAQKDLLTHYKRIHQTSFKCTECDAAFGTSKILERHVLHNHRSWTVAIT